MSELTRAERKRSASSRKMMASLLRRAARPLAPPIASRPFVSLATRPLSTVAHKVDTEAEWEAAWLSATEDVYDS